MNIYTYSHDLISDRIAVQPRAEIYPCHEPYLSDSRRSNLSQCAAGHVNTVAMKAELTKRMTSDSLLMWLEQGDIGAGSIRVKEEH